MMGPDCQHRNYYFDLGIAPSATPDVIHLAHKIVISEAGKYSNFSLNSHQKKCIELADTAFSVLSNVKSRSAYDNKLFNSESFFSDKKPSYTPCLSLIEKSLEKDFNIILKYYSSLNPELKVLHSIFPFLHITAKLQLLHENDFDNWQATIHRIEQDFFAKLFSHNPEIRAFAKFLILNTHQHTALTNLFTACQLFGDKINSRLVLSNIFDDLDNISKTGLLEIPELLFLRQDHIEYPLHP